MTDTTEHLEGNSPRPWARSMAILIMCFATLVGFWNDVEPETILLRVVIAGCITLVVTRAVIEIMIGLQKFE